MKSLSLTKPLMLVVIGHPGAGKSFFAQQFSETFSAPRVGYNVVYGAVEPLLETTPQGRAIPVVDAIIAAQIQELFKTQKTFIVDGIGATKTERMALRKQASQSGYEVLLVWVQTDAATTKYRSLQRKQAEQRALSQDEYDKLVKRFSTPGTNEPHVVISGKHTYATQAKVVLKKLVAPREAEMRNQPIVNHGGRSTTRSSRDETTRRDIAIH